MIQEHQKNQTDNLDVMSPLTLIQKSQSLCDQEIDNLVDKINNGTEWNEQFNAIQKIIALINGGALNFKNFRDAISRINVGIQKAIQNVRFTLVKQACSLIIALAQNLGPKFDKTFGNEIIIPLAEHTMNGTQAIADCCKFSLLNISRYCQTTSILSTLCVLAASKLPCNRQVSSECFCVVLDCWSRPALEKNIELLKSSLIQLLKDSNHDVRCYAKRATSTFLVIYPKYESAFKKALKPKIIQQLEIERADTSTKWSDVLFEIYSERFESPHLKYEPAQNEFMTSKGKENINLNQSKVIVKDLHKNERKIELRTPENKYVKLSKQGRLKTPEMEEFSPQVLETTLIPTPRRRSADPPTPKMLDTPKSILKKQSKLPCRSKSPTFTSSPAKIMDEISSTNSPTFSYEQMPIEKKYNKRNSNSPFVEKNLRFTNDNAARTRVVINRRSLNNATNLIEFKLENGREIEFLHKIREFSNTGRHFSLRDSIDGIIPDLIVCLVSNSKKISSLAIRLVFGLIQVFPKSFEDHLPSLFEILFADLPQTDIEESQDQNFVNITLKELQKLYNPKLLLKIVTNQFPSNQQVKFLSQVCCQPSCDLTDDSICCSLINLALRYQTNDSRKMLISIAKQNPDMIIKAQTDFPEDESYFESVLSDIDNYSDEKVPSFSPQNIHSWINKVQGIITKASHDLYSDKKDNDATNVVINCANESIWSVTRSLLYQEINSAFDQTNDVDQLFKLVLFIFEIIGISDYHIFLHSLLMYSNNKKCAEMANRIFDHLIGRENKDTLIEHLIECVKNIETEDIDVIRGSLLMISNVIGKNQKPAICDSSICKIFILLNKIITQSKTPDSRRFAVQCYVSLFKNETYNQIATNFMNDLNESQRRLILLYSAK